MPSLLISSSERWNPTSAPPPHHVAPSIGPAQVHADMTPVCPPRSCGGARVAPRTTLHYSLTPIPCSMLDRSKSVARVRSRPASPPPSLPPPLTSFSSLPSPPPPAPAALSFQTAAVARHYPTQTLLSSSHSQYFAMLLDCIRPERESCSRISAEGHQHSKHIQRVDGGVTWSLSLP